MSRTRAAASAVVTRRSLRLVFAGDGALLIACAEKARQREHEIAAILTSSDEVAAWAREAGIPHGSIEGADDLLAGHAADCLFSIYCFSIIPQRLLDLFPIAVNYHDAPLPRYAGFNAAAWAIFDGQREHGITWHRMTSDVDGGPIIHARRFPIAADETAFTLNLKCYEEGLDSFGPLLDSIATTQSKRRRRIAAPAFITGGAASSLPAVASTGTGVRKRSADSFVRTISVRPTIRSASRKRSSKDRKSRFALCG